MISVGVIGYGYWGPNWVRNLAETPGIRLAAVSDLRPERLNLVAPRYPTVRVSTNANDLFEDPTLDAVVISTPVGSHYPLALKALRSGKHVLVEKPLTPTVAEAETLLEEAARRRLTLMVDHTFVYSGAVRKIKELIDSRQLGEIYYYDSVRVNLGLFQHDVNVLWDLAVHDLSIMDYLIGDAPSAVAATGTAHINGLEDVAYLTCFFPNKLIAHLHVNWLAPVKVRRTLIGGAQQMVVYDDLEPSEKIKVYDRGVDTADSPEGVYRMLVGYRTGDMWAPKLDMTEALRTEALHFAECVRDGRQPITDGEAGLRVVQVLEAASRSLRHGGQPYELGRATALAAD